MIDESRYGPQIDDEYEELLKAEHYGRLEVWVTFEGEEPHRVRTLVDAPNTRRYVDQVVADWYALTDVAKVEVVPVGAGRHGAGGDPRTEPAFGGLHETPPAPTRATRCCTPRVLAKPSGRRLCHSTTCPDTPGDPIDVGTYAQGRQWPSTGGR